MPKDKRKKALKNKLDKLWVEVVKQKANYQCEVCHCKDCQLQAHHIEGRKPNTIRWDSDNGICLCSKHHTMGNVSAHSTSYNGQKEFHRIIEYLRGNKLLDELKRKSRVITKHSLADLEELYINLEKELL